MYRIEITADGVEELKEEISNLYKMVKSDSFISTPYMQQNYDNNKRPIDSHLGEICCPYCNNYFKLEIDNSVLGLHCPYCGKSIFATEITC